MRRGIAVIICFLTFARLSAQDDGKRRLVSIFTEAEQCYLMDDYQQLESCLERYADTFLDCQESLGDSIDVYRAYYDKMCGAFYYGIAEEDSCAYYSEMMYRRSLDTFNNRNNVTNALVLHEELAQLYYKIRAYDQAKVQLDSVFNYYDERLNDMGITSVRPQYYKTLSQLAMCNARLGHFDTALSQIDEAINKAHFHLTSSLYVEL